MTDERRALGLSTAAAATIALLALAFAAATQSRMILLDGVFNAVYLLAGCATLRIERLVRGPDDARFPFGYAYFESLINAGKGMLILGVSVIALGDAAMALLTGGRSVAAGWAIVYGIGALAVCGVTARVLGRAGRRLASPLVTADADNWRLNTLVSMAVVIGFGLDPLFVTAGWPRAAPYIDPLLVMAVVGVLVGVPVRMAYRATLELLNRAPDRALEAAVTEAVDRVLAPIAPRERHVRMVRPGRTLYVLVHVVLPRDGSMPELAELDGLRVELDGAIREVHTPALVDTVFTTDPRWAAPSAGYGSPVAEVDEV
jgi:cation diffusion facilitator family transporter